LAYTSLGKVSIDTPTGSATYDTRIASFSAVGNYPLTDALTMVGRIGAGIADSTVNVPTIAYSSTSSQRPLTVGIGVRYALTPRLDLTVDYDKYFQVFKYQGADSANASIITVGLRFSN
jgi:predicted porin